MKRTAVLPASTFAWPRIVLVLLLALLVSGCGDQAPLRIGFLGGLSGPHAALGESGRNGLLLAVEERNAAGGIKGRRIELVLHDDMQQPDHAAAMAVQLIESQVVAIVGPMTSSMATAVLPAIGQRDIPLITPTASSTQLEGLDDALFRIMSSDPVYAEQLAAYSYRERGVRRVAVVHEQANAAYASSMVRAYAAALGKLGGTVVFSEAFTQNMRSDDPELVGRALASQPDALLFVGNTVDAVRIAQAARLRKPDIILLGDTVEETLVQLGGRNVEGYIAFLPYDRDSTLPQALTFRQAYQARFNAQPGFGATCAYEAAQVLFAAIEARQPGESLKTTLLRAGPYAGLQDKITFDRFGDTHRQGVIVGVQDGQFRVLK